jgi:hypothetical protein
MAANKRRSLQGLGGTASAHKKAALNWSKSAVNDYDLAEHWAKQGMCEAAFNYYGNARDFSGRSDESAHYAKMASGWADKENAAHESAVKAVKKHCLVGGGLSGTPRRRRR